jgi:uncharacterized alpha-E superfamily protein
MLSRVAARLYWMSRYLERVENTARLVAVYGELLLDLPSEAGLDWSVPLRIMSLDDAYLEHAEGEDKLGFLLAGKKNPASLFAALELARENTRTTRDVVPSEAWQAINELHLFAVKQLPVLVRNPGSKIPLEIVGRCHQITGILAGTMSHGPAYQFVCLGRSLERADMTSRIIDVAADTLMRDRAELLHHRNTIWRGVLRALSAYQMYQQYVRRRIDGPDVVKFLILDRAFPRSIASSLLHLGHAVAALPRSGGVITELEQLATQMDELEPQSMGYEAIHVFVDDLQKELARLSDLFYEIWLDPLWAE